MTATLVDHRAREVAERASDTAEAVRDEFDTHRGEVMREFAEVKAAIGSVASSQIDLHERVRHLTAHLGAPAYVRARTASGSALEEFLGDTSPGAPNPLRAVAERWTGKAVLWVISLLAAGGAAIGAEHVASAIWRGIHP
jgi:hypothetical protein